MEILAPPLIAELPVAPYVGDPQFDAHGDALLKALGPMREQVNASNQAAYTNAKATESFAGQAAATAVAVSSLQTTVLAAASFKGYWADKVGPMAMPASVKHANRFWMLTRDVPDVAAEVPGESMAWTSLDSGQVITQQIAVSTQGVAGVIYLIVGPNVKLTAPKAWARGDRFGFDLLVPIDGQQIDMGDTPIRGQTFDGPLNFDMPGMRWTGQYEDAIWGLL